MPKLTYKGGLPSREEFQQALTKAMLTANPVDDLLELSNQLRDYEQKYDLSSTEFYRQYQAGLLPEPLQHCVEWAAIYDLFMRTKRMLEATLMRAAVYPELEGVKV